MQVLSKLAGDDDEEGEGEDWGDWFDDFVVAAAKDEAPIAEEGPAGETEEEEDEFFTEEFYPETFAAIAAEEKERKKKGLKPDPDDEGEPI